MLVNVIMVMGGIDELLSYVELDTSGFRKKNWIDPGFVLGCFCLA
jgi:hypothetical protein